MKELQYSAEQFRREHADSGVGHNKLGLGCLLATVRGRIGSEAFGEFMKAELPKLGLSRSSAYRWMRYASEMTNLFPNEAVRRQLMHLGFGTRVVVPK